MWPNSRSYGRVGFVSRRLLVEADGGSRGNPGPAAYGAVVRDVDSGSVLAEVSETIGIATNNVAEYQGLIAGLEAASAIDPTASIEVRMDSRLVVEQMSGRWKIKHEEMRRLALMARRSYDVTLVRFTWIPRAENGAADRLVNQALDGSPTRFMRPVKVEQQTPEQEPAEKSPDLGNPTEVWLVRHAATDFTETSRLSGSRSNPELSAQGKRQAESLARMLSEAGPWQAVVSSPARRARQTAQIIEDRLGVTVTGEADFSELDFGVWEGCTIEEVRRRWPERYQDWSRSPDVAPPQGENVADLLARVLAARNRILATYPRGRVIVVTHAGPIRALVTNILGAPLGNGLRIDVPTASITRVRWWQDGGASLTSVGEAWPSNQLG
ncbi:MAG: bifunctional RNase H/acid phosphatase [Actinomycetota bacterium]